MYKKKKKIIYLLVFILLSFFSVNFSRASSLPPTIYDFKKTNLITNGVIHENIERFTTKGWLNINVIRIDITNKDNEIKGMFNESGIPKRDTVSNMVDKSGALAGINGDYFNYAPMPSSMGGLINDGEMISSPIELAYALPSFYINQDNKAGVAYLDRDIQLINRRNNSKIYINTYNKVTSDFLTPTILDSKWGKKSIGNRYHKDLIEIVVSNNKVKDIRKGKKSTNIPKNGYVIAGRGRQMRNYSKFRVGDKVNIKVQTTPNIESIKFAIGAGSIVLNNGQATVTDIHSQGLHPRTGIGVNKDNTEVILVTVDGRNKKFKGLQQKAFGELLKDLGAYNGVNLDGGGSTTMAVKDDKGKSKVVNKPSGGSERKVVNGVGVYTNAKKGELSYIEVNFAEPEMFKNTSRVFSVNGFDAYKNPVKLNKDEINIELEGPETELIGNKVIPKESGNLIVHAKYKDLKAKTQVKVLDEIINIYAKEFDRINVEKNNKYRLPNFYGQDKDGLEARLYQENIDFNITPNCGEIVNGRFVTYDNPINGYIEASAGNGKAVVKIISNEKEVIEENIPKSTTFTDPLKKEVPLTDPNGYKFIVYSEAHNLNTVWGPNAKEKLQGIVNNNKIAISLNGFRPDFRNGLNNYSYINGGAGYNTNKHYDVFFTNLDSRKGSMIKSNPNQWIHLKNEVFNRNETNMIFTIHTPLFGKDGFSDQAEAKVLHNYLVDLKNKGKNVFVIHGGKDNTAYLKDGIRYIGIDSRYKKNFTHLQRFHIAEFIVNGDKINYTISNVYR